MREANWDEIFQRRAYDSAELEDERLSSIVPWEDWLTFVLAGVAFMSVAAAVGNADWVRGMPSLYPIGFSALVAGYGLSRVRWNEFLLHPIALFVGASLVFFQLMAVISGHSLYVRTDNLLDRMYVWWSDVTQGGISNDPLPVIVLLLVVTWAGTYFSAWAIFRWRNATLGLLPGGIALIWNLALSPGHFSTAFIVFLIASALLLMRLHVDREQQQWDRDGVRYPEFITLSALNVTFWATCALLIFVWLLPLHARSDTANARWDDFTQPLTRHLTPLARVFVSVNAKKPVNIHNLQDALPFQGKINLNGKDAVEVYVKITPEMAAFLREQSFDEYTRDGWKVNVTSNIALDPGSQTLVDEGLFAGGVGPGVGGVGPGVEVPGSRTEVQINIRVEGGNNEHLFSLGQPRSSDQPSSASVGADLPDVSSLKPAEHLSNGDQYTVTGSVNTASIEQLRAAGTEYPSWVTERYLQLPRDLPRRVRFKAQEITRSTETPYDDAAAIEKYLRVFPNDYDVPAAPPGQDSVDYFLFDAQRGYFDYHASAMAVMLRSIGIPARVATGYVIDPLQQQGDSDAYKLTQRQAFAWPEVYFPGVGWVEFSPTPSQPLINRPGAAGPATVAGSKQQDVGPEEPIDLGIAPGGPSDAQLAAAKGGDRTTIWPFAVMAAIAGLALVAGVAAKFAWEFGLGGLSRPAQIWEKTLRLATLGKTRPQPHDTPREFAARLRRDIAGADGIGYIAATYERTRFGHQSLSEEQSERLEAAWSSTRNSLLRRALRLRARKR